MSFISSLVIRIDDRVPNSKQVYSQSVHALSTAAVGVERHEATTEDILLQALTSILFAPEFLVGAALGWQKQSRLDGIFTLVQIQSGEEP